MLKCEVERLSVVPHGEHEPAVPVDSAHFHSCDSSGSSSRSLSPLTTATTTIVTMSATTSSLEPLFTFLSYSYNTLETNFHKLPGSSIIARYVRSSHQNDPGRTLLEVILVIFAIRTLLQSRTRADNSGKHFIKFDEKVHTSHIRLRFQALTLLYR